MIIFPVIVWHVVSSDSAWLTNYQPSGEQDHLLDTATVRRKRVDIKG